MLLPDNSLQRYVSGIFINKLYSKTILFKKIIPVGCAEECNWQFKLTVDIVVEDFSAKSFKNIH